MRHRIPAIALIVLIMLILLAAQTHTGEAGAAAGAPTPPETLLVGWSTTDITPPRPIALVGQLHKRISRGVRDPLTATVLALETRRPDGSAEQAIMISCDLLFMQAAITHKVQDRVGAQLPDFDRRKILLNATHTHTGPGFSDSTFKGLYDVSNDAGVMKASEYGEFFVERVSAAAVEAWRKRRPGAMSWGMGHAVVGLNRRAHFFNGSTVMYGNTAAANFSGVEGYSDHAVKMLFLWDAQEALSGVVINLACPSQATEHLTEISADFWHDVREELRRRHGKDLFIFPQCAPSGDQSPHPIFRKQAERIMEQRRGLTQRQEIARRIANALDDVLPVAKVDLQKTPIFRHTVATANLPEHQPANAPFYETDPVRPITFHVLRLGDAAIATNPFELYLDYATRIEARSKPVLTMLVQLSVAGCGYLPTERAIQGGGYSADKFIVGPAGGQVLVEETVKQINALWP